MLIDSLVLHRCVKSSIISNIFAHFDGILRWINAVQRNAQQKSINIPIKWNKLTKPRFRSIFS